MTITIRQKALTKDNISLYRDIYDGGKRKFEFLSLYLLPEVDAETKARNEETLQRAHQIRAERILHPETIPEVGHLMIVKEIPNDESPEVLDWIQTYIDWMSDNTDYSKAIVDQFAAGKKVAAICASPAVVLAPLGILEGKRATCYPGFEQALEGATYTGTLITLYGNVTTGEGPAAAFPFAYDLLGQLTSPQEADKIAEGMRFKHLMQK